MLGTRVERVRTKPTVRGQKSAPGPRPSEQRIDRKLFLFREHWDRLGETAQFHEDVFRAMDLKESVSRNDLIEDFLEWAEGVYWQRVGGRPTSATDRARKVALLAELLRKEVEEQNDDDAQQNSENNTGR